MAHAAHTISKLAFAMGMVALTSSSGCDARDGTVGPRGGTLVSDDGVFALSIPAGALDHEVEVSISRTECIGVDAVSNCYAVEPHIAFSRPAIVTVELADVMSTVERADRLGIVVHKGETWRPLADRSVDLDDEFVMASAGYLSDFAVVTF